MDVWRGTWTAGPEVRTGVAWGGRDHLDAHAYVALSPMVMHVEDDLALEDCGYHAGVRGHGPERAEAAARDVAPRPALRARACRLRIGVGRHGYQQLMFSALGAVFVFFFPDTVEVTYERASGIERCCAAVGYSL